MTSTEAVRRWRKNNPNEQKEHQRKQDEFRKSPEFKIQRREYMKEWRKNHREEINAQMRESYQYGPRRERYLRERKNILIKTKENSKLKKQAVIGFYSDGTFECVCCGLADHIDFYSIDHINDGGNQHKKKEGFTSLYDWLIRNNMPKGFQVYCHNCNMAKKINNGICPHKQE